MKNQRNVMTAGHFGLRTSKPASVVDAANSVAQSRPSFVKGLFRVPRMLAFAGLLISAAVTASAADKPEATVAYRPGDTVRVFVTFKEPVNLKNAMLRFGLQTAALAGQKVFTPLLDANTLAKHSDCEFELSGTVGENVATGTYQLSFINATDDANFSRSFSNGQDFPVITTNIRNDRRVEFPDITTIKVAESPAIKP